MLYRAVEELFKFRESHNFIEPGNDLSLAHAENRTVKKNVFAAGQLRVKTGPDFQQTRHSRAHHNLSFSRIGDSRNYFQQRTLACSVAANDANDVALVDVKRNIFQRPEVFPGVFIWQIRIAKSPKCGPSPRQSRAHSALLE